MAANPSTSDIPGYYYDETKKRYFKIPPSHFAELPIFNQVIPSSKQTPLVTDCKSAFKLSPDLSLYNLFHKRQLGIGTACLPRSHFKCMAGSLHLSGTANVDPGPTRSLTNMWVTKDGSSIVLLYATNDDLCSAQKFVCCTVSPTSFDVHWKELPFQSSVMASHEIQDLRLLGSQVDSDVFILKSIGTNIFYSCGSWSDLNRREKKMEMHMSRGQIPVCIRISPYTHDTFAVGGNYGTTCVVNVQIGAKIYCSLPKHFRSSVCTLAFGDEGRQLFAGYRNGTIFGWDLREYPPSRFVKLYEPKEDRVFSSICDIQSLKDSNYIISSAFNSKLSLWDLRMRAKVLQYNSHVNDCLSYSSQVDSDEKYVFTACSDECVRLWSIGDGQLLRTITPDELSSVSSSTSNPPLAYTDTLGGRYNPTLIVCNKKHLNFFQP